ncbi:MAG: transporter substrate-binding domain-containing protein [Oscillospiraceae bacterium]|nr:transporter substrate-binding domain-containing protein [Oscillospiraceae bacterium]
MKTMKKLLALLLAMMMVFALAACSSSSSDDSSEAESEEAADTTETVDADDEATADEASADETYTFIHGFDLDFPPYSYLNDDGSVGGFDVELAQAVCEYLGWNYEAHPMNWDSKDAELNSGACDCIWSGFTINGREDEYCWSIVYSDNTQMIMVAEDSGITTLADLAGKIVGVQTATSAYDMLNDYEDGQGELKDTFQSLEVYETYTVAFNDLQASAIDAIAIDVTSGNYLMSDAEGYTFLEETLGSEQYAIGFRLGDDELAEQVNEALMALVENGTYDEIGQKYPDIYEFLCLTAD